MSNRKLISEELRGNDIYNCYSKLYDSETGQILANSYSIGPSISYEYDELGRIKLEHHSEHMGGNPYDVFHKVEYHYSENVNRIFKYQTGYTNYRDMNKMDFNFDPPKTIEPPIYESNELEEITEFFLDKDGKVIESRFNDLKNNLKEITKFKYDLNNNVIEKVTLIDGSIVKNESFHYDSNQNLIKELTYDQYDFEITNYYEKGLKISQIGTYQDVFHSFSEKRKEIERKYISKDGTELMRLNFISADNGEEIHVKAIQSSYDFSLGKIITLINSDYDIHLDEYLNKENSKIVIVLNYYYLHEENQISHIKIFNEDKSKILEQNYIVIEKVHKGKGVSQDIFTGINVKKDIITHRFTWLVDYRYN